MGVSWKIDIVNDLKVTVKTEAIEFLLLLIAVK